MAKIKFVLDTRVWKNGSKTVMLSFIHKGFRKQASLGIKVHPENWDAKTCLVTKQEKNYRHINQRLQFLRSSSEGVILRHYGLSSDGATIYADLETTLFPEKAEEKQLEVKATNSLLDVAKRCTELKKPSTRLTYERTVKHIETFIGKGNTNVLDEINKAWLTAFDNYLAESNPSANARALHFRNLRAVFNYAIDEELTTNYPFRRFKIKTVKTDKRSLSVETLRQILNYPVEDWQVTYRDMFKLSFMLMGINFVDMLNLKREDMREGRIVFNRHKTTRLYSMKVVPEALELIEKYAGETHLLSIMDSRKDYLQYIRQTNNALRKIGDCDRKGLGGKKTHHAICPELSTYWARHTWATIAASLDIPKETIAAALGHGGNTVTDIYIDFDRRKVDEANRKVIDWVLYGKLDGETKVKPGTPEFFGLEPKEAIRLGLCFEESMKATIEPKKKRGRPRKAAVPV